MPILNNTSISLNRIHHITPKILVSRPTIPKISQKIMHINDSGKNSRWIHNSVVRCTYNNTRTMCTHMCCVRIIMHTTYVVLFQIWVIFLDAVVEYGDDDASASETFLPRRQNVHVEADSTILPHTHTHTHTILQQHFTTRLHVKRQRHPHTVANL